MRLILASIAILAASLSILATTQADDVWQSFETGSQASLRGLAAVNKDAAWACGSKATIIQTLDGGKSWLSHPIPNLIDVEIRSIHAWDSERTIGQADGIFL